MVVAFTPETFRKPIPVGELRWPVILARRIQAPTTASRIMETLKIVAYRHARVLAVAPLTFVAGMQIDVPTTHRIAFRWIDYDQSSNDMVIVRETTTPEGLKRRELFRIRRTIELGGRKRFVETECELEKSELSDD